jgi:hypothetical protein
MADVKIINLPVQQPAVTDYFPLTDGVTTYKTTIASAVSSVSISPIILKYELASGTNGGSVVGATWNDRPLNTKYGDLNSLCSLSNPNFTLVSGIYWIKARVAIANSGTAGAGGDQRLRLYNVSAGSAYSGGVGIGVYQPGSWNDGVPPELNTFVNIAVPTTFKIQHWSNATRNTFGMGAAQNIPSTNEIFAEVVILKL